MSDWLWNELHDLFDTDDGSLPEIDVRYSGVNATAGGYSLLRGRAASVATETPCFWSKGHGEERPLDSVPNAASLVLSGEAEPFHVVLGGLRSNGAVVPDLGVFVFPGRLTLDYRMGPGWGPGELRGLFRLLSDLAALDPSTSVSLQAGVVPEVAGRFRSAWCRYQTEHAA